MNWIDMSDRDKLFNYAKENRPSGFRIFSESGDSESYFTSCEQNKKEPDIAAYDLERYDLIKKCFTDMWSESVFQKPDLLATIVSATALKNMPKTDEKASKEEADKPVKKEAYEEINSGDGPPVFIYEF